MRCQIKQNLRINQSDLEAVQQSGVRLPAWRTGGVSVDVVVRQLGVVEAADALFTHWRGFVRPAVLHLPPTQRGSARHGNTAPGTDWKCRNIHFNTDAGPEPAFVVEESEFLTNRAGVGSSLWSSAAGRSYCEEASCTPPSSRGPWARSSKTRCCWRRSHSANCWRRPAQTCREEPRRTIFNISNINVQLI